MTTNETATPWMTIDEAGAYVHRGRRYLRKEVTSGRLQAVRICGRNEFFFRREWLDEWLLSLATPVPVRRLR